MIFACLSVSCLLVAGFSLGQKADIRTENGVRIVKNTGDPVPRGGVYRKPKLIEELRIGESDTSGDSTFFSLQSILVDDEEDIIALDSKAMCIKVFSKDGVLKSRFGRQGQGPADIQLPMGMMLSGKDIAILDHGNRRLIVFSKQGVFIKSNIIKADPPYTPVIDSRGNLYGSSIAFGKTVDLNLIKYDKELNPISIMAFLKMPSEKNVPPAELMERFYFRIGKDDSLYWGSNYKYELNVSGRDGKLKMVISRQAEAKKVTKEFLLREMRRRYPKQNIPDTLSVPAHFPKNFPYFNSIVCDDEGRIFVKTPGNHGAGRIQYDVFDADGTYSAWFEHPENEEIMSIKKNRAYAMVKENENGNPVIKRYRIEWEKPNDTRK